MTYQYFTIVVPTIIDTYRHKGSTYQYSVYEHHREISHEKVANFSYHAEVGS